MIRLNVNGEAREGSAADRTLLHVLHEELGLSSVRYGCGVGACGACTVLLDGEPVSSCLVLAGQAQSHEVTTVEGVGSADRLHPVQEAFVAAGAFQCAYCTPGFILSTIALLAEHPTPTPDEVREYLAGNLCRCGSYPNILRAVLAASAMSGEGGDGTEP
jgi:aerobic-type carbon monoxide dehydrogenase small subunit (CoxS/CutS family)